MLLQLFPEEPKLQTFFYLICQGKLFQVFPPIFLSDYLCNVDWFAWEKLSKLDGRFLYIKDKLMAHRISEESTTTDIINHGIRTNEDYEIFCKFWPKFIAKMITKFYKNSEKSNNVSKGNYNGEK